MRIRLKVAGEEACVMEIWEEKAPLFAATLREKLPIKSTLQHGKLVGDMVFFTTPFVSPWENLLRTEEVGRLRRKETGKATGAVCFYNPRQQFCIVYGDDVADEPLKISYVGEVVEGAVTLRSVGLECWMQQGAIVELEMV
ncbi:MAG: hypothetical protein KDJ86_14640 [Bauldia sp.]|uniref:hypothetical protein n=1 Tax=Bauldia sp. TaxID=2575872 RepID=UPI001DC7ACD4|nr:hypothetical protein [Bauldia sp.]MCB1497022.1 hypothetical protein [Bauldia sp.]